MRPAAHKSNGFFAIFLRQGNSQRCHNLGFFTTAKRPLDTYPSC